MTLTSEQTRANSLYHKIRKEEMEELPSVNYKPKLKTNGESNHNIDDVG